MEMHLIHLKNLFREYAGIDEKNINTETFKELQTEFNNLIYLFNNKNSVLNVESGTRYTWNFETKGLNYQKFNFKYFDLTKLDNIIFDDTYNRIYNLVNKKIFNYDIKLDELLYDTTDIIIKGNISVTINNEKVVEENINIVYTSNNGYNEKIEYIIKCSLL